MASEKAVFLKQEPRGPGLMDTWFGTCRASISNWVTTVYNGLFKKKLNSACRFS